MSPAFLCCVCSPFPSSQPRGQTLKEELYSILMPTYLGTHPDSGVVLQRLWQLDSALVVKWMVKMYAEDRSFLSRILDLAQDLKVAVSISVYASAYFLLSCI